MLTLIIRAVLVYLLVLLVFRLMGKRQIGEMQPFELVLTLIIADLATIPMAESSIPTLNGVVPLITLVVVHFFLTFLSKKSTTMAKIISGKPIIIVNPNGIDYKALDMLDITVEDVFEAIRGAGFFKLEEVQYAIMETNGVINVLPKSAFAPITNENLDIDIEESTIPFTIISEGKIMTENLGLVKVSENFVYNILRKYNIEKLKNVIVFTIDGNGECYLQEMDKPFKTFSVKLKGAVNE